MFLFQLSTSFPFLNKATLLANLIYFFFMILFSVAALDLEENFCRFLRPDATTPQCVINQEEHNVTYFINCNIPPCDGKLRQD